jgi:hypothetical protein
MGKLFSLDECTDAKQVGSLGSFLAQVARNDLDVVPGFVLPIDCDLKNGVSNELLRRFDSLKTDKVILRASVPDDYKDSEVLRDIPRDRFLDSVVYMKSNSQRRHEDAAIIIQKMLNAEVTGTIYSINPATRDSGEILIEAEMWMGETVLSGDKDTDMVLIDKRSGALSLESKEEEEICLTTDQIESLHGMIRKIERLCSFPAYVDWAFDRGKLYIIRLGPMDWDIYEEFNS